MKKLKEKAIAKEQSKLSYYNLHNISQQYDEIIQNAFVENPMPEQKPGKKGRQKKGKITNSLINMSKYFDLTDTMDRRQ